MPKFAAFLRERGANRSLQAVVNAMKAVGVRRAKSAIHHYATQARVPPVHVLRGFSAAYDVPFEDLVDRLLDEMGVAPVQWRIRELKPSEQRAWAFADESHRLAALAVLRIGRRPSIEENHGDHTNERRRLRDYLEEEETLGTMME